MSRFADSVTVTPEQRSRHDDANAELLALLSADLIGSGYRPTQWCLSRACMQTYAPAERTCPHCCAPNTRHADALQGVTP